jgi:hypothetical protein
MLRSKTGPTLVVTNDSLMNGEPSDTLQLVYWSDWIERFEYISLHRSLLIEVDPDEIGASQPE